MRAIEAKGPRALRLPVTGASGWESAGLPDMKQLGDSWALEVIGVPDEVRGFPNLTRPPGGEGDSWDTWVRGVSAGGVLPCEHMCFDLVLRPWSHLTDAAVQWVQLFIPPSGTNLERPRRVWL